MLTLATMATVSATGQVLEQSAGLEHGRDEAAGDGLVRVEAEYGHGAGVGAAQAQHHVDGAGLAGSVGTEQRDDLAGVDGQVQAVDRPDLAERAVHIV